jgi:hypothetical protein
MKTPVLARQPSGCPVCGSAKAALTAAGRWNRHQPGPGYDDGVKYGTVAATPPCPASALSTGEVEQMLRTFESWSNPGPGLRDGRYHQQLELTDVGDSVSLDTELRLGVNQPVTKLEVRIRPEDTPRLLAELTAIAVARGLVPDPAAAVREAVAAELRALAKSFGDEAHRRNEIGDDDGGCSCADDDLSCHTTEAVACYAHAQSRLNRRAAELDPSPALG